MGQTGDPLFDGTTNRPCAMCRIEKVYASAPNPHRNPGDIESPLPDWGLFLRILEHSRRPRALVEIICRHQLVVYWTRVLVAAFEVELEAVDRYGI